MKNVLENLLHVKLSHSFIKHLNENKFIKNSILFYFIKMFDRASFIIKNVFYVYFSKTVLIICLPKKYNLFIFEINGKENFLVMAK